MRLTVRYKGATVGRLNDDTGQMLFQYDDSFLSRKLELSPFQLPTRQGVIATRSPFEGDLPGLFSDSLPDYWGRTIMDRRLREAGISPESVSILKRLSLVGVGGLGALTYHPEETDERNDTASIKEAMAFASAVIEETSENLPGSKVLQEAGSNPGGRFPKLLVGWNESSESLIVGSRELPKGFNSCIMKLDMGKRLPIHLRNTGAKEYRLLSSARKAGIQTTDHWLIEGESEDAPYSHLVVQRYDRDGDRRIHAHTFGGLTHQLAIRYGATYEDLLRATLAITKDHREVVQQYRRMVFNVVSKNRDDHVRNHSFIFNDEKGWSLSPAYDLTPTPEKEEHALGINGKWSSIADSDLLKVAKTFSVDNAVEIIEQCREAIEETN